MAKLYSLQFGVGDPRTLTGLAPTFLIFVNMTNGATVASPAITESLTGSGIYQFTWGPTTPIAFLADAATTSPGTVGRYITGQVDPSDRSDEYGTTLVAIGTSLTAQGSTLFAIGTTNVALGITGVALGTTSVALGTTSVALGITNVALGTTNVALGTTNVAIGTTLTASSASLTVTVAGLGSTASSFGSTSVDPVDLFGYMKRALEILEGDNTFVKSTGVLSLYSRGSSTLLRSKTISNSVSTVIKV